MSGFFKLLIGIFTYKEPKNWERGFELLENESDHTEESQYNMQKNNNVQGSAPSDSSNNKNIEEANTSSDSQLNNNSDYISADLDINLQIIKEKFIMSKNKDIVIREFKIGRKKKAFLVYVDGMMDKQTLNLSIFPPLMNKDALNDLGNEAIVDYLIENILTIHDVTKVSKYSEAILKVLSGSSALFIESSNMCILLDTKGYEKRSIEKPVTETIVKGPQEGFTEDIRSNLTLIRKIIKNENLVTEMLTLGASNNPNCAVIYLDGVANTQVIKEVKKRLKSIDSDFILGNGMVEQFIEDSSFMLLPQILSTERPDRTASFILEGQVAVITDGSPFAIAVPITFFHLLHTSEDTFARWPYGTFLRLIRYVGLFCAALLPGLYIAITLYHVEMIPTELLSSISAAKEPVPFPSLVELLIMELAFELIQEGGIRVPAVIGQTLGIVGALILGQAAVSAGLVSPIMVIVVSVTGLGSFSIPNYSLSLAVRIIRFIFIFSGAFLGIYGISLSLVMIMYMMCSMKSFGVPFLSPVAPKTKRSYDTILRYPIWMQKYRSDWQNTRNRKRQGENVQNWKAKDEETNINKGGNNQ